MKMAPAEEKETRRELRRLTRQRDRLNDRIDELKQSLSGTVPRRRSSSVRSGFMKPASLSNELSAFMGVPLGTMVSRGDVTKAICKYIKDHDLQDLNNRRRIEPDETLTNLLNIQEDDDPVTYFTLQRFLKPHFLRNPIWIRIKKEDLPDPKVTIPDLWQEILDYSGYILE